MASMISLSLRRGKSAGKKATSEPSELPPEVTQSASDETTLQAESPTASLDDDENFHKPQQIPGTPEGLRPRRRFDDVRVELKLPPFLIQHTAAGPHYVVPNVMQPVARHGAYTYRYGMTRPLPPLPPRPQLSSSPDITTPSHACSSRGTTSTPYAESPNLAAPVTAVGALVAKNETVKPIPHPQQTSMGVLPDWDEERDDEDQVQLRYHRLHDSYDVPTPARKRITDMSVESDVSSFLYSPFRGAVKSNKQHDETQSFNSQLDLVANNNWSKSGYNFDPIDDRPRGELVMMDQLTNVSAISQSTVVNDDNSLHSIESNMNSHVTRMTRENGYDYVVDDVIDNQLLYRKRTNQRGAKEKLLLDVIERLRDDRNLVAELETLHETDEEEVISSWFAKTNLNKDGMLTGYGEKKRLKLSNYLQSILNEMDTALPEEYFLSPTQIPDIAETHDDLRSALAFVQSMLRLADPDVGRNWRCKMEMRAAMGISSSPESPDTLRGGDTSLFSLPSESTTPYTSNLSLATSITTKPSTRYESPLKRTELGNSLRRTIEIASTLVQKMTEACEKLLETDRSGSERSIRATEEIKRTYLQLMTIQRRDLEAVSDAFFYNGAPSAIVRQVSEEEEPTAPPQVVRQQPRHLFGAFNDYHLEPTQTTQKLIVTNLVAEERYQYEQVEDEGGEDLRRQVGSNDYDTNDVREGPEEREEIEREVRDFYHQGPLLSSLPCK